MQTDLQLLIASLEAKNWLSAFVVAVRLAGEITSALNLQGKAPHLCQAHAAASLDDATSALKSAAGASTIDWTSVLSIVLALLKLLPVFGA